MEIPTILVYSHDSLGVGEDGPTHQPVEHLTSLRTTPNLETWRPCDTSETAISWLSALTNTSKPTALILSRQGLPTFPRNDSQIKSISKGAYILHEPESEAEIVLIATGSEVKLAMEVAEELKEKDIMVSRLARGVPVGASFDYIDEVTLTHSLEDRIEYK